MGTSKSAWRLAGAPAVLVLLVASCSAPSEPEIARSCIAPADQLVFVAGTVYSPAGPLPAGFAPGRHYATVLKLQGCEDVVEVAEDGSHEPLDNTLDEGDSNYLAAGTQLFVVPGTDPAHALAVYVDGQGGGWHLIQRFHNGG